VGVSAIKEKGEFRDIKLGGFLADLSPLKGEKKKGPDKEVVNGKSREGKRRWAFAMSSSRDKFPK